MCGLLELDGVRFRFGRMVVVAVVLWGLGAAVTLLALGWVVREWVWLPWTLIAFCKRQGVPGFPFVPFLGQMPAIDEVLRGERGDRLSAVSSCYDRHGSTFYFTVGKTVRVSIADPPLIKDILIANSACYSKPVHIRTLGVLRDGIFASSGSVWAPQRELFNGSFHSKEIKSKIPTMIACARSAVDRWVSELDDDGCGELDMYQKFLELALDVIGRAAFGVETADVAQSVIKSFERYLFACRELVFGPPAAFPATLYSIRRKYRVSKDTAAEAHWLRTYMKRIISDRRASNCRAAALDTESSRHDILDVVINAVDNGQSDAGTTDDLDLTIRDKRKRAAELTRLTESQLLANSLTFLLAGHETTASLLTWTIYLLALHPLWQERARAEVEEFCPDGVVEPQVLNHLKLLGMILFESLRLFPPVPLIARTCLKENKVGSSLLIPEGLEVVIPVAVLHRDKSIWGDNAEEFFPARFGNGISGACGSPLAFLPFGAGPRTCLGQTLALSEAKAVLAVMLPLFSWRLSPGYRHSPDVALAMVPEFGMQVVLERLEKSGM